MKSRLKKLVSLQDLRRVGVVLPAHEISLEPMLGLMLHQISDRMSVHYARLPHGAERPSLSSLSDLIIAATSLRAAGVEAVLWYWPSAGAVPSDLAELRSICEHVSDQVGVPVLASPLALAEVLEHLYVRNIALVTRGAQGASGAIGRLYEAAGYQVKREQVLNGTQGASLPFAQIRQKVLEANDPGAGCLVVDAINCPAALVVDELEHQLKKPVIDGVTASVWKMLRTLGISNPLHGWGQLLRDHEAVRQLNTILAHLLQVTAASRTTIRIDVPQLNMHVDDVYAEATAEGVSSLMLDSPLNQRSLATVQWLEKHRQILVQDDCVNAEVPPPRALIGVYGVKAQILGPLFRGDEVMGWISVHYIPGTRVWTEAEVNAMRQAMARATEVLRRAGWI